MAEAAWGAARGNEPTSCGGEVGTLDLDVRLLAAPLDPDAALPLLRLLRHRNNTCRPYYPCPLVQNSTKPNLRFILYPTPKNKRQHAGPADCRGPQPGHDGAATRPGPAPTHTDHATHVVDAVRDSSARKGVKGMDSTRRFNLPVSSPEISPASAGRSGPACAPHYIGTHAAESRGGLSPSTPAFPHAAVSNYLAFSSPRPAPRRTRRVGQPIAVTEVEPAAHQR